MHQLPFHISLLRSATLPDGTVRDVEINGNRVGRVVAAGQGRRSGSGAEIDLSGFMLLPAPAEPHAHFDKALSAEAIRPPLGNLRDAIETWRRHASTMTVDDIRGRALEAALTLLANGTTSVRCHVDVLLGDKPLRGVEALVAVRQELEGLMDLELVALAGSEVPDADIEAALDLGVDLVGGSPHLSADPFADLRRLITLAERRGVGVDLHTDESLDGELTIVEFARLVREWPAGRMRTAGHCVRLGTLEPEGLHGVIDEILASDLGIVTLPITNLYLQGWDHPASTPRGLTAVRTLLDRGARLGAGADNVRDPFNPVGRSDAFETAGLLVVAAHLTPAEAYQAVSGGARSVMGMPAAGPVEGADAELVAIRGTSICDVVANASPDRYVIHAGRLVAHSEISRRIATPASLRQLSAPMEPRYSA